MSSICAMSTVSMCSKTPPAPASSFNDFDCVACRGCSTPDVRTEKWCDTASSVESPPSVNSAWSPGHPQSEDEESDMVDVRELHSVPHLLAPYISDLLIQTANDRNVAPASTSFEWNAPILPLHAFLDRVVYYSGLTVAPFVGALMLIDRLDSKIAGLVAPNTIHKLFLTCLSIAHKAVEEYQLTNTTIAAIGGITIPELKACEMELVTLLDWEVGFPAEEFESYLVILLNKACVPLSTFGTIGFLGA
ncbi:Cyclin-P1-1 [Diplonema papillatum]|nr:Cyclin-P1-1 [Diplonema papillatum]